MEKRNFKEHLGCIYRKITQNNYTVFTQIATHL